MQSSLETKLFLQLVGITTLKQTSLKKTLKNFDEMLEFQNMLFFIPVLSISQLCLVNKSFYLCF